MMTRCFPLGVLATMFLGAFGAGNAHGQAPAAPPQKLYTNRQAFKLSQRVENKDSGSLQEVQLFVKNGADGAWALHETTPPTQSEFIFRAPRDGEYSFCIVAVDKAGNRNPSDLEHEPPGLIVVVDRQAPEVEVRLQSGAGDKPFLQCEVRDANPDPSKTRLEYQTADQTWQGLAPIADKPGLFEVPELAAWRGEVRASGADLAGNTVTRVINVAPTPSRSPEASVVAIPTESRSEKVVEPVTHTAAITHRHLLNSTQLCLKYQIDQEGPSGVSKVEVWMTRDEGQTWQHLSDDPDRRSPVVVALPGEGKYGLSLVVANGNGTGNPPPGRGDSPDCWVEVDTTKPMAQLLAVRPATGTEAGAFIITWTASDANLKPEPIDLEYAPSAEGPWTPIAKDLKNDGNYRWGGPRNATGEMYVRLTVTDQAGNATVRTTSQPVILDSIRPRAHVIDVEPGTPGNP